MNTAICKECLAKISCKGNLYQQFPAGKNTFLSRAQQDQGASNCTENKWNFYYLWINTSQKSFQLIYTNARESIFQKNEMSYLEFVVDKCYLTFIFIFFWQWYSLKVYFLF